MQQMRRSICIIYLAMCSFFVRNANIYATQSTATLKWKKCYLEAFSSATCLSISCACDFSSSSFSLLLLQTGNESFAFPAFFRVRSNNQFLVPFSMTRFIPWLLANSWHFPDRFQFPDISRFSRQVVAPWTARTTTRLCMNKIVLFALLNESR